MKDVLSHSSTCSLFQPHLPVFTPFLSNSAPLNGRVTIPAMRSPADPLVQRGHFLSMLFHVLLSSLQLLQDVSFFLFPFHNLFTLGRKEREGCALTFFRSPEQIHQLKKNSLESLHQDIHLFYIVPCPHPTKTSITLCMASVLPPPSLHCHLSL